MPRRARPDARKTTAKYDAAGMGRRIASWSPPTTGPQRAINGIQKIRDRSRDSSRNDWAGASVNQKWATNLIGVGITPRWKNPKFTKLWAEHVKTADADCVLDAYGLQTLACRSWFDGGEVFMRRRPRDLTLPLAVPVQYQLIEAEFVPMLDADSWPGLPIGNTIRQGIERNRFGRRTAFWMYKEHPGDKGLAPTQDQLIRVLASDVRHMFEPARPGALRGVSGLSAVLVRLRSSMDFEDAVLDRQKLANLFVSFITRQLPENDDIEFDPDTGLPKFYDTNGTPMVGLEPGMQQQLSPGEDVKFANPPEAGTTYSEYMRTTHVGTAAGTGLPYEIMSGDIKDISDRALRVVINEFRRFARQRQWQLVIPMLCQPMVEWWADAAALSGAITLAELAEAKAPKWSPEGWEYIHPTQDAEGKKILIEAGLTSRARVIAERGDDPTEIDNERAEDKKRDDKLGLVSGAKPPPVASAPAPKPTPQQMEREALETRRLSAEILMLERPPAPAVRDPALDAMLASQSAFFAAMAAKPVNEIHNHVEPTPLNVNVAAPTVNLGDTHVVNEVNPTPITVAVDVQPTPINVAAPAVSVVNEVQPAAVDVTVSLPDRKTVSDIARNADGDITKFTQIETTLLQ